MSIPDFTKTVEIKASPAAVWDAIVNPATVGKYHLAPLKAIELHAGGRIVYGTANEDLISGMVAELEEGVLLRHTFYFRPASHAGTGSDPETMVRYEIAEVPGGVRLTLTHSGFVEENQTYANISGGWPFILDGLKEVVEKGG